MPRVYILCGLPFAGKTTLARTLAQHLDLPRVSIDEINGERGLGFDNITLPYFFSTRIVPLDGFFSHPPLYTLS